MSPFTFEGTLQQAEGDGTSFRFSGMPVPAWDIATLQACSRLWPQNPFHGLQITFQAPTFFSGEEWKNQ